MSCSKFKNLPTNNKKSAGHESKDKVCKELISKIEKLCISSNSDEQLLAGKVESIIKELGIVTVKPTSSEVLLDLGTCLFTQLQDYADYNLLGRVEDVFGAVTDPMYAIKTVDSNSNSLEIGMPVFFNHNHPDTHKFTLKLMNNMHFHIIQQQ